MATAAAPQAPGRAGASGATSAPRDRRMITKSFISRKTFRVNGMNFLRQEKNIRDHGDELGRPV
jgi:hypothetical protein